ncbi:hypothetical protein EYF80_050784 [Liparis tanakae]|uniref:Uncharacterized protein n=1 Tax=Liparis tanakae TaxID=230148 RepID=A0A4Z2FDS6_9TELE|nr:hypothetical protein EYF80_050784 [Liparis tanakae]
MLATRRTGSAPPRSSVSRLKLRLAVSVAVEALGAAALSTRAVPAGGEGERERGGGGRERERGVREDLLRGTRRSDSGAAGPAAADCCKAENRFTVLVAGRPPGSGPDSAGLAAVLPPLLPFPQLPHARGVDGAVLGDGHRVPALVLDGSAPALVVRAPATAAAAASSTSTSSSSSSSSSSIPAASGARALCKAEGLHLHLLPVLLLLGVFVDLVDGLGALVASPGHPFVLYWSIRGCRRRRRQSRSLPMVDSSLQRHSRDSASWFLSSFTMQSCMMTSVSIFSLNSSPMNLMLPSDRRRATSFACWSSTISSSSLSFSNSFWHRLSSSFRKFTVVSGFSVVSTLSWNRGDV